MSNSVPLYAAIPQPSTVASRRIKECGFIRAALTVLLVAISSAAVSADEQWRAVSGPTLRTLLTGQEFGDGSHHAHRFLANGTFTGTQIGRDIQGQWQITGNQLCTKWTKPRPYDGCYDVERSGRELRMLQRGYSVFNGQLTPIKPAQRASGARSK